MNKFIITVFISVFCSAIGFAQNGAVTGKIVSSDNTPLESVTVTVNGTKFGTQTDSEGKFEIKNIKPGDYILKIAFVGFTSKEVYFLIRENETTSVENTTLNNKNETLEEVVITGNINRYTKSESNYVAKMPLKNLENAQVYSVVTKELMKDQLVVNQDEALKNIPGLYQLWASTGRVGDGGSYFSSRGFITQSLLRNGIAGKITNNVDASNLERLEAIKGPSATL